MADNLVVSAGSGQTIGMDEVADGTLGTVKVQFVKLMDGTLDSTTKLKVCAEDAAHSSGDTGIMALAVRQDTAASLAGTDGDYVPLIVNSTGCLHVALSSALPAGTNAIGKLAANSGVDIGDVDVTSVIPGTGATSLGKAEDAAHGSGDTGVMALAVRRDSAAASSGADGDYEPLSTDSTGQLRVNVGNTVTVGSHAVTNAGTFAVQVDGSALTSLQLIDDAIYADDGSWTNDTSKHALVGGIYQSSPQTVTDGKTAPIQLTANGYQIVTVTGTVTVASHAVTNAGTFAVQESGSALTALQLIDNLVLAEDAAHQSGDPGVQMLAIRDDTLDVRSGTEGDYEPLHTNASGALWTIDVNSAAAAASLSVLDDWDNAASDGASVSGDVAHDSVDAGEPVKVGHVAIAHGTNPTAVAAADRTNWYANRAGVPFVIGGHPNVICHSVRVLDADGAKTDTAFVTVSSGTKIVVTRVCVTADGSNTGPINITVGFGASTLTTPNTTTAGTGILADFLGVPAGGGMSVGNGGGIIGVGGDGEDLRYTCEDPAGGAVTINVSYYTIES